MEKLVFNSNGIMKSFVFLIQSNSITYKKLTTTQKHPLSSSKQPQRLTTTPTNITKIHNHPLSSSMHPQKPTTSHNHPLPPRKKLQNNPKPSTTTHKPSTATNYLPPRKISQRPTITHYPHQSIHSDPQLCRKISQPSASTIKSSTITHYQSAKSHNDSQRPTTASKHPQ